MSSKPWLLTVTETEWEHGSLPTIVLSEKHVSKQEAEVAAMDYMKNEIKELIESACIPFRPDDHYADNFVWSNDKTQYEWLASHNTYDKVCAVFAELCHDFTNHDASLDITKCHCS